MKLTKPLDKPFFVCVDADQGWAKVPGRANICHVLPTDSVTRDREIIHKIICVYTFIKQCVHIIIKTTTSHFNIVCSLVKLSVNPIIITTISHSSLLLTLNIRVINDMSHFNRNGLLFIPFQTLIRVCSNFCVHFQPMMCAPH